MVVPIISARIEILFYVVVLKRDGFDSLDFSTRIFLREREYKFAKSERSRLERSKSPLSVNSEASRGDRLSLGERKSRSIVRRIRIIDARDLSNAPGSRELRERSRA